MWQGFLWQRCVRHCKALFTDWARCSRKKVLRDSLCLWQRKRALDICCSCVEDAYQAKDGPALQHAAYFRAFDYKALKKALCLKGALLTCVNISTLPTLREALTLLPTCR